MALTDEPEELLDIFDQANKKIGTVRREETAKYNGQSGPFLRMSEVFIVNREGQVWVPRRQAHKKIAPNGLDFSAAEHVQSGESYEQAAVRGLREELFMDVDISALVHLGVLPPYGSNPGFRATFLLPVDDTPNYNTNDFSSASWVEPKELLSRLRAGKELAKDALIPALELFLSYNKKGKG